jgi:flagellar protein FliO/FliZ
VDSLILVARVSLSLAAVLGLLWWFSRRLQSSTTLRRRRREELVVLGRQQLAGKTGVALIEAGGRRLVIGYGEQGVSLLHDAGETPEPEAPEPETPEATDRSAVDFEFFALTSEGGPAQQSAMPVEAHSAISVPARSTLARTADARRLRTPLEGSILAPATWRQAVVAAQEWTTRRS